MPEYVAYLNGQLIPDSECKVHVTDRGLRVGDVVFDVERTFNGKVFRLREHLDRLYRSLKYTRIDPGLTLEQLEELTLEVLARNEPLREPGSDFLITQFVTRGSGSRANDGVPPVLGVRLQSIEFSRHAPFYVRGAHVVFPRTRSYPAQSLDPKVKHYSRMNFALAELEATDVDPEAYPVLLDLKGNITENVSGNFFLVTNGVLRFPTDRGVLQGISRMTVIELAERLGIPTSEEDLQPYDAYTANEAFLTTTSYCILPVGRIDRRPVGEGGVPGPVTGRLQAAWSEMVGLDFVEQALAHTQMEGQPVRVARSSA